jgi:hypothetical protein
MGWLGAFEGKPDLITAKRLLNAFVKSTIEAGLAADIPTEAHFKALDKVLANAGRLLLSAPGLTSPEAILADLGWDCSQHMVMRASLLAFDRLRREPAGEQAARVCIQRRTDVSLGESIGFFPHIQRILTSLDLQSQWEPVQLVSKSKWKSLIDSRLAVWEQKRWTKWLSQHGPRNSNLQAHRSTWGTKAYLSQGSRRQIGLKAAFSLGSARLRGNKTASHGSSRECRFGCGHDETEAHLLLDPRCPLIREEQIHLWSQVDRVLGSDAWRLEGHDPGMVKARSLLLGGGTKFTRRTRFIDTLVKEFLVSIEDISLFLEEGSFLDDPWAPNGPRGARWSEGWARLESLEEWIDNKFN